jgi:hypothetical protein
MLAFNNSFGNGGVAIDPSNYGVEAGGFFLAIQEAYADFADIDQMCADYNSIAVGIAAEGLNRSGRSGLEAALESFQMSPVSEGFFGSLKDKIVKALKALKEKIIAFFKSVIQFLSRLFMSDKNFIKKYKAELDKVDPDGMKFEMYDYSKFGENINSIASAAKGLSDKNIKDLADKQEGTSKMNENVVEFISKALPGVDETRKQNKLTEGIQKMLRGGKKDKKEIKIDKSMISHMVDAVIDDKIMDVVDDMKETVEKVIDGAIDAAEKMQEAAKESVSEWNGFYEVAMETVTGGMDGYGGFTVTVDGLPKIRITDKDKAEMFDRLANSLSVEQRSKAGGSKILTFANAVISGKYTEKEAIEKLGGAADGASDTTKADETNTPAAKEKRKEADDYRAYAVAFSNVVSAIVNVMKSTHAERSKAYASCLAAALRYKKDED